MKGSRRAHFRCLVLCLAVAVVGGPSASGALPRSRENSLGARLVLVPSGSFWMGAIGSDPNANADERPRHRVRIARPFYLSSTEVTIGQFRQFVAATGYRTEAEVDGVGGWGWDAESATFIGLDPRFHWRHTGWPQTADHPVVNVTWNDAVAFCDWLSRREGRVYRLPTEAEWEYACRAGTTTLYSTGNDPEALATVGNVADRTAREALFPNWESAIHARDGYTFTAPVGRFRPNAWGLFDMHGNVWEWCSDWYDESFYASSPATCPTGPLQPVGFPSRVVRGGGWSSVPVYVRTSNRPGRTPDARYDYLGFRVVTTAPPR